MQNYQKVYKKVIKNVTTCIDTSKQITWDKYINISGNMKPVEIIIRQLCFVPDTDEAFDNIILIKTNLSDEYIGGLPADRTYCVAPQTTLTLSASASLAGPINFSLYGIQDNGNIEMFELGDVIGTIFISMDIVCYA